MTSERELARAGLRRPYGTRIFLSISPTLKRGANKTLRLRRASRVGSRSLLLRREEHGLVDLASPGQITLDNHLRSGASDMASKNAVPCGSFTLVGICSCLLRLVIKISPALASFPFSS